jgi:hypothetical protein
MSAASLPTQEHSGTASATTGTASPTSARPRPSVKLRQRVPLPGGSASLAIT